MSQDVTTTLSFRMAALPPATFKVVQFTGEEAISQPFRFDFVLASTNPALDLAELVGEMATFTILKDDMPREIHGIVSEFQQFDEDLSDTHLYGATLVPRFDRLKLSRQNQIYGTTTPVSVIDVVTGELGETATQLGPKRYGMLGLSSTDFDVRTTARYPVRDYVVQYDESNFNFISRQLEHWGIFYFFDHSTGVDRIVLGDASINFGNIAGPMTVRFARATSLTSAGESSISSFVRRVRQVPMDVTLRDYNYRKPNLELLVQQVVDPSGFGWINEYDNHFRDTAEGVSLAKVRAEEMMCRKLTYAGRSDCNRFAAGSRFTLRDDTQPSRDGIYVLTTIRHSGAQAVYGVTTLPGQQPSIAIGYRNSFEAISGDTPFRPERTARKPKISGVMTGCIDGAGDGTRAEIDALGRYKVIVRFDLGGYPAGQASQYIRMAQPYAGASTGMHFPLLKGTEVLLAHLDGDPDRPIIMGAVPNAASLIVSNTNANTHNRIVSSSGMFFEMNDGPGQGGGASNSNSSTGSLPLQAAGQGRPALAHGTALALQPMGEASAGDLLGPVNSWQAPANGLFPTAARGTWLRMGEPTTNGYYRLGAYDPATESGLLPRLVPDQLGGASSGSTAAAAQPTTGGSLNGFSSNSATMTRPPTSTPPSDTVDTGGALQYTNGAYYDKTVGNSISDVGGNKIGQIDGNQWTQVNGNDWKYVGGTSTNEVAGDYNSTYDSSYTGETKGDYASTYKSNYTATTYGNQFKTQMGAVEDITLGNKFSVIVGLEEKSNIGAVVNVNLAGLAKATIGAEVAAVIGAKEDAIIGHAGKAVIGASTNYYTGLVTNNYLGMVDNTYESATLALYLGDVWSSLVGCKQDFRAGNVTSTTIIKVDSQQMKIDNTTAEIKTTNATIKQTEMDAKLITAGLTTADLKTCLNGITTFV